MTNGGGRSPGEQFGKEVDAAEVYVDGGCSDFEDRVGIDDEAGYCDEVEEGKGR